MERASDERFCYARGMGNGILAIVRWLPIRHQMNKTKRRVPSVHADMRVDAQVCPVSLFAAFHY